MAGHWAAMLAALWGGWKAASLAGRKGPQSVAMSADPTVRLLVDSTAATRGNRSAGWTVALMAASKVGRRVVLKGARWVDLTVETSESPSAASMDALSVAPTAQQMARTSVRLMVVKKAGQRAAQRAPQMAV